MNIKNLNKSNTSKAVIILSVLVICCFVAQMLLGADFIALLLEATSISLSLFVLYHRGIGNIGAAIFFIYVTNTLTISFFAKTLFLQPIDSHLYEPVFSFSYALAAIACVATSVYMVGAKKIRLALYPITDPNFLYSLSFSSYLIGLIGWILSLLLGIRFADTTKSTVEAIGGFDLFKDLMVMGVIAATASVATSNKSRKRRWVRLILMLSLAIILGVIDNSKRQILIFLLGTFLTLFYFAILKAKHIIAAIVIFASLNIFIFPIIHYIRYDYHNSSSVSDSFSMLSNVFLSRDLFTYVEEGRSSADRLFGRYYYDYYDDPNTGMIIGRFSSIQQIDPIIRSAERQGYLGTDYLIHELQYVVPHLIYSDKDMRFGGQIVTSRYGLTNDAYPTVPLMAGVYAIYGVAGLILLFILFLAYLTMAKVFGWDLYNNVYAIFFLVTQFNYIAEGSVGQYLSSILRGLPTFLIVLVALRYLHRRCLKKQRSLEKHSLVITTINNKAIN